MRRVVNWRAALLSTAIAVVTVTAAGAQSSSAAFPGRNGLIAFDNVVSNGFQIFTMTASGAHLQQLTNADSSSSQPQFSADGRHIVFERPPASGRGGMDLWVMNADGSGQHRVASTRAEVMASPAWSPSGTRIAHAGGGIWVVGVDGHHVRRLTRGDDADPAWSPNGRWIAFDRSSDHSKKLQIWVVPAKGGRARNLGAGNSASEPEWSPDGRRIAFDVIGRGVTGWIGVVNADGTRVRVLTRFNDFPTDRPAWSPDGKKLVYQVVGDGGNDLYMVGIDGKNRHVLPHTANADDPT
jgi:TolB protein